LLAARWTLPAPSPRLRLAVRPLRRIQGRVLAANGHPEEGLRLMSEGLIHVKRATRVRSSGYARAEAGRIAGTNGGFRGALGAVRQNLRAGPTS
jgi:hypothetical protein